MTIIYFLQNLKDSVHGILDMMGMGLTTNGLTYVKRGIPDAGLVHTAYFDDNNIRYLPKSFHTLTNLTALTLDRNQVSPQLAGVSARHARVDAHACCGV